MLVRVLWSAILGIDAYVVEAHLCRVKLPKFIVVGQPGESLKESKERVMLANQYLSLIRQLWLG